MVLSNNNALALTKKQLASLATTAAALAVKGAINNAPAIIDTTLAVGKKAYNTAKNALTRRGRNVTHVGGMNGAIMAPVAVSRQLNGRKPKFSGTAKGGITVTHREYLTQVNNTTGNFVTNGGITGNLYQVNPLNGTLFSWLPSIAANFDQYTFTRIAIQYVPMCGTTEVGRVGLYWDKDSTDPEPLDRVELANYAVLKETPPWGETVLNIPTDRIKRFCDDSSTQDHKLIDLGQVGFAVYGGNSTNACGDLFITYTVVLHSPQPTANLIETMQTSSADILFNRVGPNYAIISKSATNIDLVFRATGIFLVNIAYQSTGVTTISSTGGASFLEQTTLDNLGVATMSTAMIQVTSLPAVIRYTNTTNGGATVQIVRATKRNTPLIIP